MVAVWNDSRCNKAWRDEQRACLQVLRRRYLFKTTDSRGRWRGARRFAWRILGINTAERLSAHRKQFRGTKTSGLRTGFVAGSWARKTTSRPESSSRWNCAHYSSAQVLFLAAPRQALLLPFGRLMQLCSSAWQSFSAPAQLLLPQGHRLHP